MHIRQPACLRLELTPLSSHDLAKLGRAAHLGDQDDVQILALAVQDKALPPVQVAYHIALELRWRSHLRASSASAQLHGGAASASVTQAAPLSQTSSDQCWHLLLAQAQVVHARTVQNSYQLLKHRQQACQGLSLH